MRDEVTLHPQCDDFGVQQLVSRESIPNECTILCLEDRYRPLSLGKRSPGWTIPWSVFLSNGVDVDGTIHDEEVIMFRRLSGTHSNDTEPMLVNPALYTLDNGNASNGPLHRHHNPRLLPHRHHPPPLPSSPSSSSAQSEPSWLIEAEEQVESTTPPPPSRTSTPPPLLESLPHIPESRAATPPTHVRSSSRNIPGARLYHRTHIDGVLPPSVLTSLAQPNSIVCLPTCDGVRMALTRVRNAIWLGTYTVDLASWRPETCTYHATPEEILVKSPHAGR